MNFKAFTVLTMMALLPAAAQAQGLERITEQAVHDFYAKSAAIYSLPYEEYMAFMNNFMTEDFTSSITMNIDIEGRPRLSQTSNDTKAGLLKNAKAGYDAMQGASVVNTVKSITISPDGKSASVEDDSMIKNMLLPSAGPNPVYMDGGGPCSDRLALSPEGRLQVVSSTCTQNMVMRKGRAL